MIEELPDLPFALIFRELSYEDRFSLRRACKKLKALVDRQVSRSLFVFLDCYACHETLFYTGEHIYYKDSCRIPDFDRFISSSYKENFKRLKKLTIFFKGLIWLEKYVDEFDQNLKTQYENFFFKEVWCLEVDLEHLNYFEYVEHLEIKGIGRVFGQLRLNKLRILSIESRRLSQFDLDCPALRAMCISLGARPNFIDDPHPLDCLSTKLLLSDGVFDYLRKLYSQCPNLSTIGFEYPHFLGFSLWEANGGRIRLPQWRVIKLERAQYLQYLKDELAACVVHYQKGIEPEVLQIIFNDQLITLEQFISIIQIHKRRTMPRTLLSNNYLQFLQSDPTLNDFDWLFSSISQLFLSQHDVGLDEKLVVKVEHLRDLLIYPDSVNRIEETIFRKMLTTWTKLERLWIGNPAEQLGQNQLDQMPGYWPNLCQLGLGANPENFRFIAEFKNLRKLELRSELPKEELLFLFQNCPSLYHIYFLNRTTDFFTSLDTKSRSKYWKPEKIMSKYINRVSNHYMLSNYRQLNSLHYIRFFKKVEKMLDYFYDEDLFNRQKAASFKTMKDLFKIALWNK